MAWTQWVLISSLLGATGAAMGSFGAHILKTSLSDHQFDNFQVAVRYQLLHAIALLGLGVLATRLDSWQLKTAGWCLTTGIILFSGSLYGLSLSGIKTFGYITPFGGLALILGWLFIGSSVLSLP